MSADPTRKFSRLTRRLACLALIMLGVELPAGAVQFVLGDHAALPGTQVRVPVSFQGGTGLSSLHLQVNYDPSILGFVAVTNLGAAGDFALESHAIEGRIEVVAVQADPISYESGVALWMIFQLNPGSIPGMQSALTIAEIDAGGVNGLDLATVSSLTHANGSIRVVSAATDTDGRGLPDWWQEKYFGRPSGTNPTNDSDGDGMSNLKEYLAGTNPTDATDFLRLNIHGKSDTGFKLGFKTVSGKHYQIQVSQDLNTWSALGSVITGDDYAAEINDEITFASRYYRVVVVP